MEATAPELPKSVRLAATASIVVAGLAAYANAFEGPFLFDDVRAVEGNADLERLWPFGEETGASNSLSGRPLTRWTFALNRAVHGLDVTGYHVLNLALHLCCALLLLALVLRVLAVARSESGEPARWCAAWTTAFLWVVHPLGSECIDYVTQRTEILSALFLVTTVLCAELARSSRQKLWEVVAVLAALLAVASKESGALAPLLVLLFDLVLRRDALVSLLTRRRRLYLGLFTSWFLFAFLNASGPRAETVGFGLGTSAWDYFLNQCHFLVRYLSLVFWPDPLVLDYGEARPFSLTEVMPQALLLVALFSVTIVGLVRRAAWALPSACFFLLLAPSSSFVPIVTEIAAERRMYLALAAVLVPVALLVTRLPRKAAVTLVLLIGVALGWRTSVRNADYRDGLTVWEKSVADVPDSFRSRYNLGRRYLNLGELERATLELEAAVELQPAYFQAWNGLGETHARAGRAKPALDAFRRALEEAPPASPDSAIVHSNLGSLLSALNQTAEARERFEDAVRLAPENADLRYNLALSLANSGELETAREHLERALELDPLHGPARDTLDKVMAALVERP